LTQFNQEVQCFCSSLASSDASTWLVALGAGTAQKKIGIGISRDQTLYHMSEIEQSTADLTQRGAELNKPHLGTTKDIHRCVRLLSLYLKTRTAVMRVGVENRGYSCNLTQCQPSSI